ncbi:MAG: SGNH/GDSL hydrolase family protein [Myxococcota bacterium]
MRPRPHTRRLVAKPVLLLLTLAATLVALEVGLRLFWDGFYLKLEKAYATYHPTRGWKNKPGAYVPYGEPEFATMVRHDSWGFRSREHPLERVPGKLRIFALGDSFTYGIGVENDETFCARLEQLDSRLEVLNGGVNGYGTSQELLQLKEEGLAFHPDLVLIGFFWNDVGNSYRRPKPAFRLEGGVLRYPPPPDPNEVPPPVRARGGYRKVMRHSYAYRFLSDRLKLVRYRVKIALGIPVEASDMLGTHEREAAWELELALLREIDRLARGAGARTLLVLIPDQVQVEPGIWPAGLRREDYEVQERMQAFAAAQGIPVIDLLPALRAERGRSRVPLYYRKDRHLNARGHEVAARTILAGLRDEGFLAGLHAHGRALPTREGGPLRP